MKKIFQRSFPYFQRVWNYPYFAWLKFRNPDFFKDPSLAKKFNYSRAIINFYADRCQTNLLVECSLNKNSVVFDVGGHTGEWADKTKQKYNPYIYIFEPNPNSYSILEKKYNNDPKVLTYPFGLSDADKTSELTLFGKGSSIYSESPSARGQCDRASIQLKDIKEVIDDLGIDEIDLIKINIEGGEYSLLQRMLDSKIAEKCRIIRIQFHEWYIGSHSLRRKIRKSLLQTHNIEWDYSFVWESWERKKDPS